MIPTAPSLPGAFAPAETVRAAVRSRTWIGLLPLAFAWLSLFAALATDWSINAQYSYGWSVPILGLAVFWRRRHACPAPQPHPSLGCISAPAVAFLILALPVRLIEEANPEWRMILWSHAFCVAGLTMIYFHHAGGWPWTKHFAFVALFPLVGVPIPMMLEQTLVQNLTSFVTLITSHIIDFVGIPAFQRGNIIEVRTGLVGVEEACSGIRSLQSSIFVALFLGEFYVLHWKRRLLLIVLGAAVALVTNVARTYAMVHVAASHGVEVTDEWHGLMANVVLVLIVAVILAVARRLRPRCAPNPPFGQPGSDGAVRVMPLLPAFAALIWLVCVSGGVEWWYRTRETKLIANSRWSVITPVQADGFATVPIHERTRAILRYSSGHAVSWRDDHAREWIAYYLRWERGRNSAQLARAHTPDVCLTGAGGRLTTRLGRHAITVGSLTIPFEHYAFDFSGRSVHVFYCLSEDYAARVSNLAREATLLSRLRAAFEGRRHLGQTVLEVGVHGQLSPEEARSSLALQLQRILVL